MQSISNASQHREFPDKRENTGNLAEKPPNSGFPAINHAVLSKACVMNSLLDRTGNFTELAGKHQGSILNEQGPLGSSGALPKRRTPCLNDGKASDVLVDMTCQIRRTYLA